MTMRPTLLTIALLASACASNHAPPAGHGDAGTAKDGSIETDGAGSPSLAKEYCEHRQACAETYGFPFDDLASCQKVTAVRFVAGPRLSQVERCAKALDAQGCDERVYALPPACAQLTLPRPIPEGEPCDGWVLCEEGTFCAWKGDLCGTCTRPYDNGEACVGDEQCASHRCEGKLCVEQGAEGEPCSRARDCAGFCDDGTCRDFVPVGGSCQRQVECESNRCDTHTCVPFQVPRLGDPCQQGCWAGDHVVYWSAGLDCQQGRCVEAPGDGETCGDTCRESYVCVEGRCEARPKLHRGGVGKACLVYDDCRADLLCYGSRCTGPAEPGEDCFDAFTVNGGCAPDAFCDTHNDWVCAARRAEGEACEQNRECVSGLCEDNLCAASFCE